LQVGAYLIEKPTLSGNQLTIGVTYSGKTVNIGSAGQAALTADGDLSGVYAKAYY